MTQSANESGTVFLTAPRDLQHTESYEEVLRLLGETHGDDDVLADRDLFADNAHWRRTWRSVYARATMLYILVRHDGTVGLGVYKQWKWLKEREVPCSAFIEGRFEGRVSDEPEVAPGFELEVLTGAKGDRDPSRFARLVRTNATATHAETRADGHAVEQPSS